jgi:transposase-like protein
MASTIETEELNSKQEEKQEPLLNDKDFFYRVIRKTVQDFLEAEMTSFLGAESSERCQTRQGYRSGHRPRSMNTRVGKLRFEIPCERSGQFHTKLFANYQRSEQAFVLTLQEMYLHGVSTRRVKAITEAMCSLPISSSEVSRLTAQLDGTLEQWRRRRFSEPYFALLVDARYEHVRANHRVDNQAVITVTGISAKTGQREILGIYVVNTESATSWGEVFKDLLSRGLYGIESVTSDAHEGLVAAMMKYFQGAPWQRCQRHFSVNARDMVHKKDRKELTQDLRSIFDACDREHAQDRVQEVVAKWLPREPQLAVWLEENIEPTLTCFQYPPSYRSRVRTTNMPERLNEEWNRRSEVIRIFPNSDSCLRLMTAMAMEQTEVWAEQRPYLDIKELNVWKQTQAAGVPTTGSDLKNESAEGANCRQKSA